MSRLLMAVLALIFTVFSVNTAQPVVSDEPVGRLSGIIIGIDPGHQSKGNNEKEAVAPGSDEMKAKVSSGTQGVSTRIPEYQVNLDVALMLRDALENEGATVIMTREKNDVDISNQERAIMCNEAGCQLVLRIHCNGAENKSVNGMGMYVRATGPCAEESYFAGECLIEEMCAVTGAKAQGIFKRDTYTGLNWSEVPSVLVEMGYMSNPEEDEKLCDPEYQALLVDGMVEGICRYFDGADELD
ncbi:MAG: N-acetylmuramoyl-L-alanine amidase [Clostridia bacterium]|nr:N-acetylmuramoyl-L-alanine amidase [Clostridia bacterium]